MARLKRIHVSQHTLQKNLAASRRGRGGLLPVMRVITSRRSIPAHSVEISGPSKLVYSPDKPLNSGARLWIETHSPVIVDGTTIE